MFSVKYNDAAALLTGLGGAVSIAEAHGCLCGAVCAAPQYSLAQWLDEIVDESRELAAADVASAKDALNTLHRETIGALSGGEMEFTPFLPDDDAPLAQRAEALAQWCQGFLYGFGSAAGVQRNLSAEVQEILLDLTQIARASAGDTEPTEEDESDYVEIVEYVRIGVQTVHDEMRPTMQ